MALTAAQVQAEIDVVIETPTPVQSADFGVVPTVELKTAIENKSVYVAALPAYSVTPMQTIDFSTVSTADEVTEESLNRTTKTLRDDFNTKMALFANEVSTKLSNLASDTSTADSNLASDINVQLNKLKNESNNLITDLNKGFLDVKNETVTQNTAITSRLNTLTTELMSNDESLKAAIDAVHDKVQALDDVFGTDADIATKINTIDGFIATLRETDLDFVTAVDNTIDEVNSIERPRTKEITITANNGKYSFNTLAEGIAQFVNANDYKVTTEVIGNESVQVAVLEKDKDGFVLFARSNGVHYRPQTIDCSATPVKVMVSITHNKLNPTTMNIDTLNASWLATGSNTTDANSVGA
jgi:hypothetical protein